MDASGKLHESANKFKKWYDVNYNKYIAFNASKTKIMAFASRSKVKKCRDVDIHIGKERLKL